MRSRCLNTLFTCAPQRWTKLPFPCVNSCGSFTDRFLHSSESKLDPKPLEMSRPAVYITRKMNDSVIQQLSLKCDVTSWPGSDPVPRYELLKNVLNKDALFVTLTDKIDVEVLEKANKLKVIATMSVGYDHLDVLEIKKRQIKIGYTPGVLTHATAELTVALLLATSRRLFEANESAGNGGWQAWSPFWMTGPGLQDSTVGIVGLGRIGLEVARRVKPFGVKKIVYYSRTQKVQAEEELGATMVTFEDLLGQSDFVIVTCALTPDTHLLFNADAFKQMKDTAVFVNTSRGGIVDQNALIDALDQKKIWGAGLDVMTPEPLQLDSPLFKMKNCVILPHIGSACIQTRDQMAQICVDNILAALEGQKMPAELKV